MKKSVLSLSIAAMLGELGAPEPMFCNRSERAALPSVAVRLRFRGATTEDGEIFNISDCLAPSQLTPPQKDKPCRGN